ncbi:Rho termination factor [Actinidia rufa]|uniref:Rho termination factor n=1 Tax=Actinidia rufa TaxID=165716 RepID=A0A7J0FLG7_9ERIC|nr:Rho termination factor [Actinidia rufa]
MSLVTNNVPDGRCLLCSGVSGRAVSLSPCSSRGGKKNPSQFKIVSLKCTSRGLSSVCKAGSSGYKRNPDFSRQNKHVSSQSRNRQDEERDGFENFEESEMFSSQNGPLLSVSSAPKFRATGTPGPRGKEVVKLFRKIRAQIRERAATQVAKKMEEFQGHREESNTGGSLLKLLRKHTTQQQKKSRNGVSSRDFILDQPDQNGQFDDEKSTSSLDSNYIMKTDEIQEHKLPSFNRVVSNFRRRSPIPRVEFQPNHTDSVMEIGKSEETLPEPEIEDGPKLEVVPELGFSDSDVFDAMSENEPSDFDEGYIDDDAEVTKPIVDENLRAMKLTELKALAKSRGMKGFSRLKKHELTELLSSG